MRSREFVPDTRAVEQHGSDLHERFDFATFRFVSRSDSADYRWAAAYHGYLVRRHLQPCPVLPGVKLHGENRDRKSTRLNSSHQIISYAVFCLKKKNIRDEHGN